MNLQEQDQCLKLDNSRSNRGDSDGGGGGVECISTLYWPKHRPR